MHHSVQWGICSMHSVAYLVQKVPVQYLADKQDLTHFHG